MQSAIAAILKFTLPIVLIGILLFVCTAVAAVKSLTCVVAGVGCYVPESRPDPRYETSCPKHMKCGPDRDTNTFDNTNNEHCSQRKLSSYEIEAKMKFVT